LTRIWGSTDARHVRSQRVLQKLGMVRESVRFADHVGRDGEPVDEVVYGLSL
jgi:RimJ/RimL family protein N-acetyltransferase